MAVAALLVWTSAARADGTATAREHYKQGMKAYDLGHYADAVKEFEAAYQAQDDPVLLFNLGQAYRFEGRNADAIRSYRAFLRRVPDSSHRQEVESRIVELQRLIDEQDRVKEKPPAEAIAPSPGPSAPPPPAVVPPIARPWAPARPLKITGLTLMGVGAASLVLGGVFAGLASSAADKGSRPGTFDPSVEDRMKLDQSLDVGLFVAGGALAAGGLVAFLVGQLHPTSVELSPVVGLGRAGAIVEGRF